jgi:7,8-dihydropterin-6-yl-methyl-4-(beta-D-ribofuranosyl)aminobenzene 5'-phosphate synthase
MGRVHSWQSGQQKRRVLMAKELKILADNHTADKNLKTCWGFSCLIDEKILFDTGENSEVLKFNMNKLNVLPERITKIIISHDHFDHTGGLEAVLEGNSRVEVYLLSDFSNELKRKITSSGGQLIENDEFIEIDEGIYTTGNIEGKYAGNPISEQAIVIKEKEGLIVITGCSHPLIIDIVERVKKKFPKDSIFMALGGFHLLDKDTREVEFIAEKLKKLGVEKVGPTHCTGEEAILIFREKFGNNFVPIGVGATLKYNCN